MFSASPPKPPRRAREASAPSVPGAEIASTATSTPDGTRFLLVDFRSGEPVAQHPDVADLLASGWQIRSAVPRIVEAEGPKLLVMLQQGQARPVTS